jgi:hypothetical protein
VPCCYGGFGGIDDPDRSLYRFRDQLCRTCGSAGTTAVPSRCRLASSANRRAESFWVLRRGLERGEIALPPDEKLADELCAMRWSIGLDGKVQIEAKNELRARIGRSPDRADAVAMAFRRAAPMVPWRR